jgi:hypothetical protein
MRHETNKNIPAIIDNIDSLLNDDIKSKKGAPPSVTVPIGISNKESQTRKIDISELFSVVSEVTTDTSIEALGEVCVNKKVFAENPFHALLLNIRNDVGVPVKNVSAVERILSRPEVQQIIPADAEFAWSKQPEMTAETEYYFLYLLKKVVMAPNIKEKISSGRAEVMLIPIHFEVRTKVNLKKVL